MYVLNATADEADSSVDVTIALSHIGTAAATADISTADGTATAGSDYTSLSSSVTIAAGSQTTTVTVVLTADNAYEGDETFTVTASNVAGGAELGTNPSGEVTITDDDVPSLSISGPSASADEGDTLTYTVLLTRPTGHTDAVSVDYAASSTTATKGTTCGSVDYAVVEGTLSWGGTESGARNIIVNACPDSTHPEANETVTVTLTNPVGAPLASDSANGIITSVTARWVTGVTLTCTASGNAFNLQAAWTELWNYQYRYRFNNSGAWYYSFWGNASLNGVGAGTHTVSVQRADTPNTGSDSQYFQNVPTTSATAECTSQAQPTLSVSDLRVDESDGMADISVTMSRVASVPVTVQAATSDGTATTADGDYSAVNATYVITPGTTTATVSVPVTDDSTQESDETFTVTLSNPTNSALSTSTATVTISANDQPPTVTVNFAQASYTVDESDDATSTIQENQTTVTVTLDADPQRTVTIPIVATNQGGATGSDYSGVPASVVFNSGETSKTFTFTANDDAEDDDGESVKLSFGTLPTNVSVGTVNETTVTITDDDNQPDFLS